MKKLLFVFILCCAFGLYGGIASAQVPCSNLNEPGSLLVYPLVDNINYRSIIEITNLSATDQWLACYFVGHNAAGTRVKKDFVIFLTQKEPTWWETYKPYTRDGNYVQAFDGYKGFIFCWAIDSDKTQVEITQNSFKGDALLMKNAGAAGAFQYNAIPHQRYNDDGRPRVLSLDGSEYTAGAASIYVEGFAEGVVGIGGTLAIANLDMNFETSTQPPFDINMGCWNQNEQYQSRHLNFPLDHSQFSFEQYDLTTDLQLDRASIGGQKFNCAAVASNLSGYVPMWAVFLEFRTLAAGAQGQIWGTNVFQNPGFCAPTTVTLGVVPSGE